jgi:hypothetical protein
MRGAAELAALMPPEARADLVAWGPKPTAGEQLEVVIERERTLDWTAIEARADALTDDRPLNEYYLLRRLRRRR